MTTPKQYYNVGVIVFDGADILDFAAPMEVLSHTSHNRSSDNPDRIFKMQTIARKPSIRAAGSLAVNVDLLLGEAINAISSFDILIVPGGPTSVIHTLLDTGAPELDVIRKFSGLPQRSSTHHRILFSVCTGAFLLGATGILAGVTVTTHHTDLDTLRDICSRANKGAAPTTVEFRRYIDSGLLEGGAVRLITAGGISSGLDATFYLVSQLTSPDMAAFIARVMEYDWKELEQ
ncbi:ThiJ/PfpI family protein [Penicillium riverlandense]|uniref:ThiJ/PfpI family protein n=1 Tax=Penicillium riverlandense TaxID=1903569 RepID=UPI00254890DD|nr:ThiJ/PfpI family protein [Penicillium riverlandense]KAJ5831824.1 ThiJ/PfpI family protein [Penicillium riverlandense]